MSASPSTLSFQSPLARMRGGFRDALVLALVAAATTWVALLSWKGFAVDYGGFMGPLIVIGVVVALSGAVLRWLRVPGPLLVLAQLVIVGMVVSLYLTGSLVPIGEAWLRLEEAFRDALGDRAAVRRPGATRRPAHRPVAHRRRGRVHAAGRHHGRHPAPRAAGRAAAADDLQHPGQPAGRRRLVDRSSRSPPSASC